MNTSVKNRWVGGGVLVALGILISVLPVSARHLVQDDLRRSAPELTVEATNWINTGGKAVRLYENGTNKTVDRVTVLAFWTHGCINCERTVPFWNDWAKRYAEKGVSIISIHTPELDFERKPENVRRYVREKGIVFPVAIDNDSAVWNAYGVRVWPTTILLDAKGREQARWEGELDYNKSGGYKRFERRIEQLLRRRQQ
ncbi:MAG: redoxin domain-containing protein [Capsulimonadales bacterium]|nr:redoxin domain-containing protein [Capsulimonadales bacterium]